MFRFSARFARPVVQISPDGPLPGLAHRNILVADNNGPSRETVRQLLSEQGATVTVADCSTRAIELIRQAAQAGTPFDVVVADSSIPADGEGYQIAPEAGLDQARFVIMLPGGNLKAETLRLKRPGLGNYIVKPVKRNELLAAVAAAADSRAIANGAAAHPMEHRAVAALPSEYRLRILFADDSPDNRALIKAYMKSTPHLVDFAEDGREAISQFMAGHYDLVFMDIQMPIVDGYTAVEEIRRWENHLRRSPTPIVALTASADNETIRRTKETGCDLHISKPLKKAVLLETITRCVPPPQSCLPPAPPPQQNAWQ